MSAQRTTDSSTLANFRRAPSVKQDRGTLFHVWLSGEKPLFYQLEPLETPGYST